MLYHHPFRKPSRSATLGTLGQGSRAVPLLRPQKPGINAAFVEDVIAAQLSELFAHYGRIKADGADEIRLR